YINGGKIHFHSKRIGIKLLRIRNYSLSQIFKILQKFELLEQKDSPIYQTLEKVTHFRNRIHIYNWFDNFEINEKDVFTEKRLDELEKVLVYVISVMEVKYARP
ncbi:MAG: hypothetical protein WCO16_02860, partial [bacterium]